MFFGGGVMAGASAIETDKYSVLEDFDVDVEVEDEEYETFSLCFWVYLLNSTTFPSTIIRQVHSDMSVSAPFLVLDEDKKMMLLPLTLLHMEAPDPVNTSSWTQVPNVSTKSEFPLEKWVHVGCQVSRNCMRLLIDGEIVGEQFLTSLLTKNNIPECPRKISLFSVGGDGYSVQGFIQCAEILPASGHVEYHYMKEPPLLLSINKSSSSGIGLDDDDVWKASCREIFSLDVVLSNAIGQPVHKDVEVVASLLHVDSMTRVDAKMNEAEAPLLISCEGIEFSADNRPIKLVNGRSSFRLKISQLSSKSDNRLFCIKFEIPNAKNYPFLQALTNPIRCISISPKRLTHIDHHPLSNESPDLPHNTSSVKQARLGKESVSGSEESYQQCNSHPQSSRQFENGNGVSMHHEEYNSTDSENSEMRDSVLMRYTISDSTVFRYCLGNLTERSLILKEITNNSSDDQVLEFANQVSVYSGCSHHCLQINMAKKLIDEGTNVWILISRNNQHVHWDNVVNEIEEHFMRISKCSSRSLTHQDLDLLRRISGCYEYITQENFEKMWCWLFPVASSISWGLINGMWRSSSPKWVEGFITKEDAEHSLQGQEPGTFILRFPISRSWPHPDAGSLVVTYVGHDFALHHKQLKIDNICQTSETYMDAKPLQDMLLAEPELSRLGRIIRSH